jgi:hypothetical protein
MFPILLSRPYADAQEPWVGLSCYLESQSSATSLP